jgi:ribonuclease Z
MKRRWLLIGLAAVVGLALLAVLLRGPIALRVMRRVLTHNLTADMIGELPDGLHIVLCGAGGPLPDPVRSGPCVAVVAGKSLFIVDSGSGAARNLTRMLLSPGRVEALFLTHFHSDHIDGLGELAMLRWTSAARQAPLPVFGPNGVEEVVGGFNRAYHMDAGYRTAHHGPIAVPPTGSGMEARMFETPAAGASAIVWEENGLRVTAFKVDHEPVYPAVGYRFDYGGRSVVISGDTKKSDNVLHHAEHVDLLVHEALAPQLVAVLHDAAAAAGRHNVEKIASDILSYHTTPVEAAQIAQSAGVRHLLYYHVIPPLPLPGLESVFLAGVSDAYSGGVTLGRDGTMISLPRSSVAVNVSKR